VKRIFRISERWALLYTVCDMRQILRMIFGILLILYGIIALVTPLTPASGIAIFVGMELVGIGFLIPERIRKLERESREWMKRKFIQKQ